MKAAVKSRLSSYVNNLRRPQRGIPAPGVFSADVLVITLRASQTKSGQRGIVVEHFDCFQRVVFQVFSDQT